MAKTEHNISEQSWVSIKEAAQWLGVHPTTLRRWVDAGEIPVMLTPGGHRRFSVSDIERFAEERRRLRTVSGLERIWAEQALTQAAGRLR
ncbi:MAG: DNA binding domain protein, excisionase family [Anaerolineales bacterium]|nr:DNA binding domain protein, excisionase family [Anaerolineales bacterium]